MYRAGRANRTTKDTRTLKGDRNLVAGVPPTSSGGDPAAEYKRQVDQPLQEGGRPD